MKMFLTRIGFWFKGNYYRRPVPEGSSGRSGIGTRYGSKSTEEYRRYRFCFLTSSDVVRHPLVQKIVEAYESFELKEKRDTPEGRRYGGRGVPLLMTGRRRKGEKQMTINIEYEAEKKLNLPYESIIEDVVNASLDYEKCPYEAEVNVILTDNAEDPEN